MFPSPMRSFLVALACVCLPIPAPGQQRPSPRHYDLAAYVWPAFHDEPKARVFWPEGIGEWQTIRKARPKFPGHWQPRVPLWGYVMEDDPQVMEMKINAAISNGINIFIYDWYWYENGPFLEEALQEGFLKARNHHRMQFYLMWANHDATTLWDLERSETRQVVWPGTVDRKQFEAIVEHLLERYLRRPNYYKIDGKPVFSVFDLENLIRSFGGLAATRAALEYFDQRARQAGLPGIHLQAIIHRDARNLRRAVPEIQSERDASRVLRELGFESITNYTWAQLATPKGDYGDWAEQATAYWERFAQEYELVYFPNVSIGWDNNPRFKTLQENVITGTTPASFAAYLWKAMRFVDHHRLKPPLIIINAWNEWPEGSYLEPDTRFGFGYLHAIRELVEGQWDY